MTDEALGARQQTMVELWERHMAAEFVTKDVEATMATMTAEPVVNHVPVMTGGVGSSQVRRFYGRHFIPGHPPDVETVPVARTVGTDRIVDELVYRCTHTIEMPWMRPGVEPTGRRIEVAVIVVVEFEDGKISGERIYWDQASVLAQVGLIDPETVPAARSEAARKILDPAGVPSNGLIERAG
jgi:carboxymethylenebutenolidase